MVKFQKQHSSPLEVEKQMSRTIDLIQMLDIRNAGVRT